MPSLHTPFAAAGLRARCATSARTSLDNPSSSRTSLDFPSRRSSFDLDFVGDAAAEATFSLLAGAAAALGGGQPGQPQPIARPAQAAAATPRAKSLLTDSLLAAAATARPAPPLTAAQRLQQQPQQPQPALAQFQQAVQGVPGPLTAAQRLQQPLSPPHIGVGEGGASPAGHTPLHAGATAGTGECREASRSTVGQPAEEAPQPRIRTVKCRGRTSSW